jgi:asparagine synthase (glutamine-hydrolysing)
MAAQFGRWNLDGAPVSSAFPDQAGERLKPWGPEGQFRYRDQHAELLWFSFETTEEHPAKQPMVLDSGEVLLWDGRLDNGREILGALGFARPVPASEVEVVAAAWSAWGENCLARLIGDWALSLWIPRSRRLLLAADILATRHLCYAVNKNQVLWSSVPDPLILLSDRNPGLDEEYLAGWLGSFPAAHLTPFREIRRVPPASIVTIGPDSVNVRRYWDFDGTRQIRYTQDAEYEEHFLELFRQSVRRRLRSSSPILAELSGGMDSSAIVCVADQLTSAAHATKIDTVSWYNDNEPHWNERPWFMRVEAQRAKSGLHIDVNAIPAKPVTEGAEFWFRPGAAGGESPMLEFMMNQGSRVLLSGIGGDEFLGGVPTPLPELEDLFARGKFLSLWRRNMAWALVQQRPWFHLLRETVRGFVPASPAAFHSRRQIPWLLPDFISRQSFALGGYRRRLRWTGPLPGFQENADAIEGIRRQLGCMDPSPGHPFERRYPFLDRNLLEFVLAIPREQLVRPGQRRSLMRRALRGTVPDAILERRRKAFITRSPIWKAEQHLRALASSGCLASEEVGIVDFAQYRRALHAALAGSEVPMMALLRTMALEQWLEALRKTGFVERRVLSNSSGVPSESSGGARVREPRENGAVAQCRV